MTKKKTKAKPFVCKYCQRGYTSEAWLFRHVCEQKRRWDQQDSRAVKIAFMAFTEFMDSVFMAKRTTYTYEDFMSNSLYLPFVRYGNHLTDLSAVDPLSYTTFLIKNNVKVKDWVKDYPYITYIRNMMAKESPETAISRSIRLAEKWAIENDTSLDKFFEDIPPNKALLWISNGKISPWFVMASSKSHILMAKLTDEQEAILSKYIDRATWKIKIKKFRPEFNKIQKILKESNL